MARTLAQTAAGRGHGRHRKARVPGGRGLLIALGLSAFLCGAVIVDILTFSIVSSLYGDRVGKAEYLAYVEHRIGLKLGGGATTLPDRDYVAEPLSIDEKPEFAQLLPAALPAPDEGWTLRDFERDDFMLLRPEYARCRKYTEDDLQASYRLGTNRGCPMGWSGEGFRVYARDDHRIAVLIRYLPLAADDSLDTVVRNAPLPPFGQANFGAAGESRTLSRFHSQDDWHFGGLARSVTKRNGKVVPRPQRLYARKADFDALDIFVVSNAPESEVRHVLFGLNFPFLEALIARPVVNP